MGRGRQDAWGNIGLLTLDGAVRTLVPDGAVCVLV